jgi:hypothetical protein
MPDWIDPDEAPLLTVEVAARAEVRESDRVIRPASGTFSREGAAVSKKNRQTTGELKGRISRQ